MKAVRVHHYHELPKVEEVAEPKVTGPWDVIVRIGGAGLCRTDLHIIEGQWAEKSGVKLPYTIGHENAGWVQEVGSAVSTVAVGDTVIMHPLITCGFCRACRAGDDMHCTNQAFPGISVDGGMANLLKTSARAVVKLDPSLHPKDIAALADAGLTAYHAVKKAAAHLYPGTKVVVIGAGGLGHIGVQCLKAMTSAEIIVVDRSLAALELTRNWGADHTVVADGSHVAKVKDISQGQGVEAPGVSGATPEVDMFADAWTVATGTRRRVRMAHGVYAARDVRMPEGVPGRIREAEARDHELAVAWIEAFQAEAMHEDAPRHDVEQQIRATMDIAYGIDAHIGRRCRGKAV